MEDVVSSLFLSNAQIEQLKRERDALIVFYETKLAEHADALQALRAENHQLKQNSHPSPPSPPPALPPVDSGIECLTKTIRAHLTETSEWQSSARRQCARLLTGVGDATSGVCPSSSWTFKHTATTAPNDSTFVQADGDDDDDDDEPAVIGELRRTLGEQTRIQTLLLDELTSMLRSRHRRHSRNRQRQPTTTTTTTTGTSHATTLHSTLPNPQAPSTAKTSKTKETKAIATNLPPPPPPPPPPPSKIPKYTTSSSQRQSSTVDDCEQQQQQQQQQQDRSVSSSRRRQSTSVTNACSKIPLRRQLATHTNTNTNQQHKPQPPQAAASVDATTASTKKLNYSTYVKQPRGNKRLTVAAATSTATSTTAVVVNSKTFDKLPTTVALATAAVQEQQQQQQHLDVPVASRSSKHDEGYSTMSNELIDEIKSAAIVVVSSSSAACAAHASMAAMSVLVEKSDSGIRLSSRSSKATTTSDDEQQQQQQQQPQNSTNRRVHLSSEKKRYCFPTLRSSLLYQQAIVKSLSEADVYALIHHLTGQSHDKDLAYNVYHLDTLYANVDHILFNSYASDTELAYQRRPRHNQQLASTYKLYINDYFGAHNCDDDHDDDNHNDEQEATTTTTTTTNNNNKHANSNSDNGQATTATSLGSSSSSSSSTSTSTSQSGKEAIDVRDDTVYDTRSEQMAVEYELSMPQHTLYEIEMNDADADFGKTRVLSLCLFTSNKSVYIMNGHHLFRIRKSGMQRRQRENRRGRGRRRRRRRRGRRDHGLRQPRQQSGVRVLRRLH